MVACQNTTTLPLDLKLRNLGVREDGTVVLFDFYEGEDEDCTAFKYIAKSCLESFSKGKREIFDFLCEGIKETDVYTHLEQSGALEWNLGPVGMSC